MNKILVARIYDKTAPEMQGFRILVDRLWPRGISKEEAHLDFWAKDIAPTDDLRKWFDHEDSKWDEFKERYVMELNSNPNIEDFKDMVKTNLAKSDVILFYGAKDTKENEAIVLQEYLEGEI